ncbi:hypothetical protein GGI43DRAFT_432477 [Trichoderma evansii]
MPVRTSTTPPMHLMLLSQATDRKITSNLSPSPSSTGIDSLQARLATTNAEALANELFEKCGEEIVEEEEKKEEMNLEEENVLPHNDTELALQRLWAEMLRVEVNVVHTNMNFLQCGGDSLRAILLSKALKAEFNLSTTVPQLLRRETTIQYLSTLLGQHESGQTVDEPWMGIATVLKDWIATLGNEIDVDREGVHEVSITTGWWQRSAFCRIEVWVGNLTDVLERANVISAFRLLEADLQSQHLRTFIFISGIKQIPDPSDAEYQRTPNEPEEYSQTKSVSEQLTLAAGRLCNEIAQSSSIHEGEPNGNRTFMAIKPGYIVGDQVVGLSSTDVFIWKLVAEQFAWDPSLLT